MQARIYISGFVKGVGFRWFVKSNAKSRGLTGWVKNADDGRVEVLAQGEKAMIEKLIKLCGKGSLTSQVRAVEVKWEEENERFVDFKTVR
jgi:acylphosphatase